MKQVARVVQTGMVGYDGPKWRTLYLWCPACDDLTALPIPGEDGTLPATGRANWEWNGDLVDVTVSPSILKYGTGSIPRCHSFLRAGRWEFLSDCTHALAGQTVNMVALPDWVMGVS